MTIHIPKRLLWAILGLLVVGGIAAAFFIGRSSSHSGSAATATEAGTPAASTAPDTGTASIAVVPPCNEKEAEKAITGSAFEADVRRLHVLAPSQPLISPHATPPGYSISRLACSDLTGDGKEEMLVQLACCTGSAPAPWAVFTAADDQWRLALDRVGIPGVLSIQGDSVVEKTPAYGPNDPLCCPSSFRFGRVIWNGDAFVYHSDEGTQDRTIKAGTQGVVRLGAFKPQSGSPLEAAASFGTPSSATRDNELCRQSWLDLGLVINFANLGGSDPCSVEGRVGSIELQGDLAEQADWKTTEGATIGMSAEQLRSIYPSATFQSFPGLRNVYVLIEGPSVAGSGGGYPVLAARIADGKVSGLRMGVGAAGD